MSHCVGGADSANLWPVIQPAGADWLDNVIVSSLVPKISTSPMGLKSDSLKQNTNADKTTISRGSRERDGHGRNRLRRCNIVFVFLEVKKKKMMDEQADF